MSAAPNDLSIDSTSAFPTVDTTSDVPGGVEIEGLPDHLSIHQLYLGCLSQASYVVADTSTGRAVVVDPRRDVDEVTALATAEGLTVQLVIETHFHADFLSGHLELAAATGAPIGVGAAGTTDFASHALADGEIIDLGRVQVETWATPGHTPESICLVVRPDPDAAPVAVITGDTLFVGDVGRPDLLVSAGRSAEEMGAMLHDSLQRLLTLPDATLVLPAHGAGSACGKALAAETVSTIGEQRRTNAALQVADAAALIALVTDGQSAPPGYFSHDAALNRQDRPLLDTSTPLPSLDGAALDAARADGAVIVDVRSNDVFGPGHIAGSINVGLGGRFAEQVGSVVAPGTAIVLAGRPDETAEGRLRLARIGFDGVVAAVDPVALIAAEPARAGHLTRLTAGEVAARTDEGAVTLVDVRGAGEVGAAPVAGAVNIPLPTLVSRMTELDPAAAVIVVCAGGARSATASSVLRSAGFSDVADVLGGAAALGAPTACSITAPTPS